MFSLQLWLGRFLGLGSVAVMYDGYSKRQPDVQQREELRGSVLFLPLPEK